MSKNKNKKQPELLIEFIEDDRYGREYVYWTPKTTDEYLWLRNKYLNQ